MTAMPSADVMNALNGTAPEAPTDDALGKIRAKAREAKEIEYQISDLEERTKQLKERLTAIVNVELVDLMQVARVNFLGIEAHGNLPAFDAKLKPHFRAIIPADATDEQREAAFAVLINAGAEDLIKTQVTINFPKEARAEVAAFLETIPDVAEHEVKATVNHMTLTKWLKECVNAGRMPPLEPINGFVGHKVDLAEPNAAPRVRRRRT
jgi:hypothetical protein